MKKKPMMSSTDSARSTKKTGPVPVRHAALRGTDQIHVQYGELDLFVVDGRGCVLGRPSVRVAIDAMTRLIVGMGPTMVRRRP